MLTFKSLRAVLAEEKANQNRMAALPSNFWKDVQTYILTKSALNDRENAWEIESAKQIINDIIEIRENKLLKLAAFYVRSGIMPENIAEHEKAFFNSLTELLKKWHKLQQKIFEQNGLVFVTILQDIPQFIDEKNTYGPFRPGDVASLPQQIAKILVEKGAAQILEAENEIS
jgi:DNA replication initiation complex subunit (GINS family)